MSNNLVIVESPAKAKTIEKFLGKDFTVLSEVGSKEEGIIIHPNKWTSMMKKELVFSI